MTELDLPQVAKNISIEALRMFFVLSEVGSISKTAQLINRSQPAVSLQLKKLEHSLGSYLFSRDKGQFHLTPSGEILHDYARQMLSLNDDLIAKLAHNADHQTIRLGIPNDFVGSIWESLSPSFQKEYPDINLEVYEDISINLIKMLHNNNLDLVIAILPKPGGHYCGYSVAKKLLWFGDENLLNHEILPLVTCFKGCSYRHRIEQSLQQVGIQFNFVMTTNNFQTIHSAVAKGVGVTASMASMPIKSKNQSTAQSVINEKLPDLAPLYFGIHHKPGHMSKEMYKLKSIIRSFIETKLA